MKKLFSVLVAIIIIASFFSAAFSAFAAGNDFMKIREADLKVAIENNKIPKESFSDQGEDGENNNTRLTRSPVGISKQQMFRVTRTTADTKADNALRRLASIYTDRKSATNAEAYMYYIELPEELYDPVVEFSWNFYDGDSTKPENGHIYNGTVYTLSEENKSWTPVSIKDRYFDLPTGFKGYLLFKPSECSEIGTQFDAEWQLETTHIYVHELRNYTVLVSRPFMVEHIGDMGFAAYVGDDTTTLKHLFTGDELSEDEAVYEMKVGDVLYALPEGNNDLGVKAPDLTYLPTRVDVEWTAFDGASEYAVRLFKMNNTTEGKTYSFENELKVEDTSARFEALTENGRYYVIVYALDTDGKEIAVSDSLAIYALKGINFDKADSAGISTTMIVIIAIVAVVVIAAVIVVILLTKKKKQ